ncbi:hypothetical protein WN51_02006 [Melipona quadrifasciata]|uniref:Uncharacterized protein n=1 Tax=Melipona quadrifasciata TaxID=166423 RepID=A0A0N0BKK3_9HYME|nr:hypothetical protein WN51_02006 [Melipona quadrifasciata]
MAMGMICSAHGEDSILYVACVRNGFERFRRENFNLENDKRTLECEKRIREKKRN